MKTVFLTHSPAALDHYFGPKALAGLKAMAHVRLNPHEACDLHQLLEAAGACDVIVADRLTAGTDELFTALPRLAAFCRCAVDIRNIDVPAASRHGILVTQASGGFMASVSEWIA